jgi:pimeloyl-ACP methyl ester carboxylesterase
MRLIRIARAGALVLLGAAMAPHLAAQGRQPVVLQHGFLSNAGTFDQLAPWLEQNLYVSTSRYTTGWNSPYEKQASRLLQSIGHLPDTTILVGHSNGGLIARRVANMRRTKGFVTIGTPHTGAPLAASLMNGGVELLASSLQSAGNTAREFYGRPEFDHPDDSFRYSALWAASAEASLGSIIGFVAAGMRVLDDLGVTVLTDMQPGSGFFNAINTSGALQQELAFVGGPRVAFNSSVRPNWFYPEYMIWKGLMASQSLPLSESTDATIGTLLMAYDHYAWYYVPGDMYSYEKQTYAVYWLWAAATLSGIDMSWCQLIGAWTGGGCEAADGIAPVSRQYHPGVGAVNLSIYGPAHQEEISSTEFRNALSKALQQRFLVKPPATAYLFR